MEKENEDFPRMTGAKRTIQILEFLSDRDEIQWMLIQEFVNTHILNMRLRDFLTYGLIQYHLQSSGRRIGWYEITEKGKEVLIYHLERTGNIGESHIYAGSFKALQRSDILLRRIYTRNTLVYFEIEGMIERFIYYEHIIYLGENMEDRKIRDTSAIFVVIILLLGLLFNSQSMVVVLANPSEEISVGQSFDRLRHFSLNDGIPSGSVLSLQTAPATSGPEKRLNSAPFNIQVCDDPQFDYMAVSPYYKVFFKGTKMRMSIGGAWIEFELRGQKLGEIRSASSAVTKNSLSLSGIFDSVDLSYAVGTELLTELVTLREPKEIDRIILKISWEGISPEFAEDGSILFTNEEGKGILKILPPYMRDAQNLICTDLHYEIVETEEGYELHKVIEEKGIEWLKKAVYPVVIDPSMQTFEDAWESSGLTPYGQYFRNLSEYVNPANGLLTVTQTDLVIPGRGLDLVISRVYNTPAVSYGGEPYEYEPPPVNLGKGWQLNFPYIGEKYLHLWGGTQYKIEWVNNTFENHEGTHFILVKNGDSTYTLTTANGSVYEFSIQGKLTSIKDLDQNAITFNYSSGVLTSITDTIGRIANFSYSGCCLWKIIYNNAELEYGYNGRGNLVWMDDFLNRRTFYSYDTGFIEEKWIESEDPKFPGYWVDVWNHWLLARITYPTTGYTTYTYDRYEDSHYYKYHVTHQRVYDTNQVRHFEFTYTGNFSVIASCTTTVRNQSDIPQGSYHLPMNTDKGVICEKTTKNGSGIPIRKYAYTYNSRKEVIKEDVYNDGSNLSYTLYYAYDNWGNLIYYRNAEGHEQFFSYSNTSTSCFFISNTGAVIREFSNAFSGCIVPGSVHTVLLGIAERQDETFVREAYLTYDFKAHPTQTDNCFGNSTTWLTFSGTFNEKTGNTSFPIDLSGHTVAGNSVLQITGLPSDDTFQESHSSKCHTSPLIKCTWSNGSWSGQYFSAYWSFCTGSPPECDNGWASIGPFTHYPGTLGYQSYTTNPPMGGKSNSMTVTTYWKPYPVHVKYNLGGSPWTTITSNLGNATARVATPITAGSHTLYFSESSSYNTKFSWTLYVPVDNSLDTYTTIMSYDTYGNVISVIDPESNTVTVAYSSAYSYAYPTEISTTVGSDIVTKKATYDFNRGWITSIQEPEGVNAGSGYDYLYTYDVLGRIIRKEFPLLPGQSERSYVEAVYDCENGTVTLIDPLGHYIVREHDKLGRLTAVKVYTGQFGTGTLYATTSYTYDHNGQVLTARDSQNHTTTYTYDFFGRVTQVLSPDSSIASYSYDDTSNKVIFTGGRGYDRVLWFDWLSRLTKVEEEYETNSFAVTTYQYDEGNHLISFTDAENRTTSYTYGSLFGLTQITYPDSAHEDYEYSVAGNIISYSDAKGNETQFLYDSLYRLVQIQYQDESTVSFTYDLNSNRTRMDDNSPNEGDYVEYEYDHWNRLITETRHILINAYTVSYQYDANRLTSLTYPDGTQILYFYDDLNRMTEIRRYVDGSNDEILMDNVQYNAESLLTQFDYGNGLRATFSYDSRDRILTLDIKDDETSLLDLDYTYDSNSNITQLTNGWRDTNSTWHSQAESYSYDGLDRLTSASSTSWSHVYSYDRVGNRTAKDGVTYTLSAVNEVTALSDGSVFTYDANGNRVEKSKGAGTWTYMYDYANRLTRVEKNSVTLGEYIYDGDGKRMQVAENGEVTTYIYSGINVLFEENANGTAAYIYGPMGRLAKRTTIDSESHTIYYHCDHQGSTRLVTDESRNIVADVKYHPFGESAATGEESYLYTGKEKDSTGLYYYGARYYDPEVGRFITRDPLAGRKAVPQSLNRYTYCLNNPVKLVDPAGLETFRLCDESGACIRIITGGDGSWVAYDANGQKITDSEQIKALLDQTNKSKEQIRADQARAAYLMLLVTHPKIQGDPDQVGVLSSVTENTSWFDFKVKVNGVEQTIHIIIDERNFDVQTDPRTGDEYIVYATTGTNWINIETGKFEITIHLYQDAFASVAMLFHIMGHEGCHMLDILAEKDIISEKTAYAWNLNYSKIFPFPYRPRGAVT